MTLPFDQQALLEAVNDSAAVIATDGRIVAVNAAWRTFSSENGGPSDGFVDSNYLQTCSATTGEDGETARSVENGLREVLELGRNFRTEYACHSGTARRWFEMTVTRIETDQGPHALVLHRNITAQRLNRIDIGVAEMNARHLADIVATMPVALVGFDLEGTITSWNSAAEELYGYTRDEILGHSIATLFPPDEPRSVPAYIDDIVVGGQRHFLAMRRTRAGDRRTISVSAAPVRDASGNIVGVSNLNRDVTERRDAEERLRSVLDNLFAFVGVLDLDGVLIEANRAPLEAAGLSSEDVIGRKFWDCHWWSYAPEAQRQLKADIARALKGEVVRHDAQVRMAGGLIWIDFQLSPLRDANGRVVQLIPSGMDVSDRRAAAAALAASHDTFRNLVEHSPFGIVVVDADFRVAQVSDGAKHHFRNVDPLIGRDHAEVLRTIWTEPFATEVIERFRQTLETGQPYHSPQSTITRQDSDELESYDWRIDRIILPDGRPGVVCHFYDLSERQRYEEQIRLLMREVNHRSKNLLTVVTSMARQTARDCSPEDFVAQFGHRLLGLSASQDLIVEGNWQGVTVEGLVLSQLKHLGEHSLRDRFRLRGERILLTPAAAQGIGMALHELATNAMKYGSLSVPEGRVEIDWTVPPSQDKPRFRISWTETGGPRVEAPQRTGFGRTVIERMAAVSAGGDVELEYAPEGLRWQLRAPMDRSVMHGQAAGIRVAGKEVEHVRPNSHH